MSSNSRGGQSAACDLPEDDLPILACMFTMVAQFGLRCKPNWPCRPPGFHTVSGFTLRAGPRYERVHPVRLTGPPCETELKR